MITLKEYLKFEVCNDQVILSNIRDLLDSVNALEEVYKKDGGKAFITTSGLRTKESQIRIYKDIAKKKGIEFDESKVPMGSKHINGQAIDIFDPKGDLQKWLTDNEEYLEELGLYCEDFKYCNGWVHFQSVPPKSGKRFFIP